MQEKAILYTSMAGHARQYAKMLAGALGIPAMELGTEHLAKDTSVVFIGWVRAGIVVGLDDVLSQYQVRVIGVVGMRYQNLKLVDNLQHRIEGSKVCYLQGGFEPQKLKGLSRILLLLAAKAMCRNLKRKNPRNGDDESMLELLEKGGSKVSMDALGPMIHTLKG